MTSLGVPGRKDRGRSGCCDSKDGATRGGATTTAAGIVSRCVLQQQYTSQQTAHDAAVRNHPAAMRITASGGMPAIQSITTLGEETMAALESIATAPMPAARHAGPRDLWSCEDV